LTIMFEDPFWIGLFELIDEDGLHVCKVTFGAEHYKPLFPDCEVIGLDYKAQTPWEAEKEFAEYFDEFAELGRGSVSIIANSIGAFYAMCALVDRSHAYGDAKWRTLVPYIRADGIPGRMDHEQKQTDIV
jgi:Protein of unknown function (DUF2992).